MDYTVVSQNGKPAFAVVPYDDFMSLLEHEKRVPLENGLIPHEIVERHLLNDVSLVKCWREHIGLTQIELADKAGLKQSSLARIESGQSKPRKTTLEKLAEAMNLTLEQLEEE